MEPTSEVPDIQVRIKDKDLPPELYAVLLDVDVQDDTEGPSACRLSFIAWDEDKVDVSRVDDALFDMGSEIEIKLGYVDALETVCKVEIVGVELELSAGQAPRLSVRGYDKRHRLRRGTRTRTFTKMKDSDIAAQIADENNLSPRVEDSKLERDYVLQDGKSDLDFLHERAAAVGFEVVVDGKDLLFRPAKASGSPLTLQADQDLTDLSASLKAVDQVGAVEVRGWDPENKQAIVGKSSGAGQPPAAADGDAAFGKATIQVVDRAITRQDEADRAALAAFEKRARRSMGVQGTCPGRTDLRAGIDVDIKGAGSRFSGVYRLISVSHRFSPRAGFSTSFSGERKLT